MSDQTDDLQQKIRLLRDLVFPDRYITPRVAPPTLRSIVFDAQFDGRYAARLEFTNGTVIQADLSNMRVFNAREV